MAPMPAKGFLEEFQLEAEWSAEHDVNPRTTARYRQLPDGLPFLQFGGRVYIPRKAAEDWIHARVQWPNRRQRGRPRKSESLSESSAHTVQHATV
jgi:hypothetical protein